jgi:hypothetical protein
MFRVLLVLGVAAAICAATLSLQAADKPAAGKHTGTVESTNNGTLVMTGADGKQHSHAVGADVTITIDGKAGRLVDLKKGDKITVATDAAGTVTSITCSRAG